MYKAPRGTSDILPEEQKYWEFIENKARSLCKLYGFERIETPVFEEADLFIRSVGEGTDIVTKEMYVFKDRSDNSLALRPEGTAPICRAYIEHGMDNRPQPVKLYYFASIFRYERPQAGRYRQHHQFGCEAIGESAPAIDAELIDMAYQFYNSLGLGGLVLQLNSIGCKNCRPEYLKKLKDYYSKQINTLCPDCKVRYEKNLLRLLDCKQDVCQAAADKAPKSAGYLCTECETHFEILKSYLNSLGLPYYMNHRLVRGLDYYNRTVFEIQPPNDGSQSALGGGGRYDSLIEQLGGKPAPAVGFGAGIERIIANLKIQNVQVPDISVPGVYVASLGPDAKTEAVKITAELRKHGIAALMATGEKSLKAQLKQANGFLVDHVIIIGEEELKKGNAILRSMKTSQQQTVSSDDLISLLK